MQNPQGKSKQENDEMSEHVRLTSNIEKKKKILMNSSPHIPLERAKITIPNNQHIWLNSLHLIADNFLGISILDPCLTGNLPKMMQYKKATLLVTTNCEYTLPRQMNSHNHK